MSSDFKKFKCVLHFGDTERGVIMYTNITYSWLVETVRSKFKLEPSVRLNFKFAHPSFDVRMDITDDDEVTFFAEYACSNQEMPHLYVAKAKECEEVQKYWSAQENPTFYNFFDTNTTTDIGYSPYEANSNCLNNINHNNNFLNEGPSQKNFESNDPENYVTGFKDEVNFTKPGSSFAFGSDDDETEDDEDNDDEDIENPKPIHHNWKNIFSLMPDGPETPLYQPKQIISKPNDIDTTFFKGKFFMSKDELETALGMKCLEEGYQFLAERSEPERYYAKCYNFEKCKWRINSTRVRGTNVFEVTGVNDVHTCDKTQTYPNHRNANKKLIGHIFSEKLKDAKRDLKPRDIQKDMLSQYKTSISYQQAWRGKDYGLQMIRGSPTESFGMLPYYCHNLEKKPRHCHTYQDKRRRSFRDVIRCHWCFG